MPKQPSKRKFSYDNPKKQCNCGAQVPHTCQDIGKDFLESSKFTKHHPFDPNKKESK